jgi:hypothetical protein
MAPIRPRRADIRRGQAPPEEGARLDVVGTVLSALGLGLIVYGVLRSGTWGLIQPKEGAPEWLGLSPVIWLILGGGMVLRVFLWWENHRLARGEAALVDPAMLRNPILRGGLIAFFFQYLRQAGLFSRCRCSGRRPGHSPPSRRRRQATDPPHDRGGHTHSFSGARAAPAYLSLRRAAAAAAITSTTPKVWK